MSVITAVNTAHLYRGVCFSLQVFNFVEYHSDIEHKLHKVILILGVRESHSNVSIKVFLASISGICLNTLIYADSSKP